MFIGLYFSYQNGFYASKNRENMLLTEEKIKEYETDLKNGVDVSKKSYLDVKEHYDNNLTNFTLKLSKKIENGFDKTIKFLLLIKNTSQYLISVSNPKNRPYFISIKNKSNLFIGECHKKAIFKQKNYIYCKK